MTALLLLVCAGTPDDTSGVPLGEALATGSVDASLLNTGGGWDALVVAINTDGTLR